MGEKYICQNGLFWMVILVFAWGIFIGGCTSPKKGSKAEIGALLPTSPPKTEVTAYILRPGDVILVRFFYFPRLDSTLKIRPDGYISIVPLDDVKAAGITTRDLDEKLTRLYPVRIENPELTVIVKEFAAQKVYVGGEVRGEGIYDLEMNMTALEAIFRAGGALNTGHLESIIIIRKKNDGTPRVLSINLAQDIISKKIKNDIYLRPLDILYVPKTYVAKINQFVDQYIRKMIPVDLTAGFSYFKAVP